MLDSIALLPTSGQDGQTPDLGGAGRQRKPRDRTKTSPGERRNKPVPRARGVDGFGGEEGRGGSPRGERENK